MYQLKSLMILPIFKFLINTASTGIAQRLRVSNIAVSILNELDARGGQDHLDAGY